MLKTLRLENYTLAKQLEIQFEKGLNVITGESGAGKSVIVGSIELLLGARAQSDFIRYGEKKAVVEAGFLLANHHEIKNICEEAGIDFWHDFLMRREISAQSSHRIFINDSPVIKQVLEKTGRYLIDLHGQHDHQHLLQNQDHIDFIDSMLDADLVKAFRSDYSAIQKLLKDYQQLIDRINASSDKRFRLQNEWDEISSANCSQEEEELLLSEEKQAIASEMLQNSCEKSEKLLNGEDYSISLFIKELRKELDYLSEYHNDIKDSIEKIRSIQEEFNEMSFRIATFRDKIENNPDRLKEIQDRLFLYEKLKRKFGKTTEDVVEYAKKIQSELSGLTSFETEQLGLEKSIKLKLQDIKRIGKELTKARKEYALFLQERIQEHFKNLGMPDAELEIRFSDIEHHMHVVDEYVAFNQNGFESLEFYIKTNKGNAFLPLNKTASGGELSRVMLALKSILAEKDQVAVLVFDEIDSGISGKIAEAVALEIKKLSRHHQIICITHSAQLAALADTHFHVSKQIVDESTETQIKKLDNSERIREIALLMSGKINDTSIKLAEELIMRSEKI